MTTPTLPTTSGSAGKKGRRRNGEFGLPQSDSSKARIFLALACLWPMIILALIASSAPHIDPAATTKSISSPGSVVAGGEDSHNLRLQVRNVLDRVDIMGYGPTHPRVAVVLVGSDPERLQKSLASVFSSTDLARIFVAVVVVEGREHDAAIVKELQKIDAGEIPHWHGMRPDLHGAKDENENDNDEEDPHGNKVHVMFNPTPLGISESREDAVMFVELLCKHHEDAGLKSPQEDILLLLLQSGAELTSRHWLAPITDALIVPPPLHLGLDETDSTEIAMKIANAVAFNVEGPGKRTSFDATFRRIESEPSATDVNLSSGASYPTPALHGAAVVMRLETYINLPMHDVALTDEWSANLDLALNLWLCGDGIDMIRDLTVTLPSEEAPPQLNREQAARFAAAWMGDVTAKIFFHTYLTKLEEAEHKSKEDVADLTYLEWETYISKARDSPTFRDDLAHKCRSFKWYVEEVNHDLSDMLEPVEKEGSKIKFTSTVTQRKVEAPKDPQKEAADEPKKDEAADLPDKPLDVPEVKETPTDDFVIPEREGDKKMPSKPLRPENLEIIQKAKPVDITVVDVSGGHKEHPHMGATDENGEFGYIHDETALRKNPPPFHFMGEPAEKECAKRDNNYKMLTEKVFVDLEADKKATESGKKRDTIFCFAYTIDSGHPKIPNIRETWGPKCDGFMVASNKTDPVLGTVNIVHEGPEEYNNIWQKVRSMWSYIYDNYYEKYDWFHIGGDDLFLIVENLRLYLESEEIKTAANGGIYLPDGTEKMQTPLFLGRRFAYQGDMNDIFNSGGSGYTLNKAALKALVVDSFPTFMPHAHTFSEDTMVARAFRQMGVYPYDTKDDNGGERYMPFMPGHHYGYRMPEDHSKDWYARYSINIKEGVDHCAARSVAFHYVKGMAMKRLFAMLYGLCPAEAKS